MKQYIVIILVAFLNLSGCLSGNWATVNNPITFLPQLAVQLQNEEEPIMLNEQQSKELLNSLRESVRDQFCDIRLASEIKAYWYETTKGKWKDSFTFVRVAKDSKSYSFISYNNNGRLFSSGGGRMDIDWARKWLE
jgi:hypothetical protein